MRLSTHTIQRAVIAVFTGAVLIGSAGAVGTLRQAAATLPKPATSGGMSLTEALARRRSVRAYSDRALTQEQIGQLCWAAQGITESAKGLRTAPSAMALYSVGVFVADSRGVHEYRPKEHALRRLHATNVLPQLRAMTIGASSPGGPPVVVVLGVNLQPLESRAGARAERYACLEAGHVAENVLLQATALGLGSVPVGGFDEERVTALLKLPEGIRPVYLLPVGYPAGR